MSSVQQNNKRIAKNTMMLYIRMLLQMVIGLYTSRVVLQALGFVDYGIYNVVGGVVSMFEFLNGSMGTATSRFLTFELGSGNDKTRMRQVFSTALIIHAVIALFMALLCETVGYWYLCNEVVLPIERLDAAKIVFHLSIIAMIISVISVPFNAAIISHEKMGAFAYISILEVSLNLACVIALQYIGYDKLIIYAIFILLIKIIIRIIYSAYCSRHFDETHGKLSFDKDLFKNMASFAAWIMNGSLAAVCYTQGLNLLLNAFFGPVINAARGVAVQVQSKVTGFCTNFQAAVNPQIIKQYASGEKEYLYKLIVISSKYSILLLFVLSLPIILEIPFILKVWLKDVPDYTSEFVVITLIIGIIESMRNPINTAMHATGNIKKFQIIEGTASLLILPAAYVCLKFGMGPISVFYVQMIGFIALQIIRIFLVCPAIGMQKTAYVQGIVVGALKPIIPSVFVSLLIKYTCSELPSLIEFFVVFTSSLLVSALCVFYLALDKELQVRTICKIKNCILKS